MSLRGTERSFAAQAQAARVRLAMSGLLRVFTLMAGVIILLGGLLLLVHAGGAPTAFHSFHGEPKDLTSVSMVVANAMHGDALAVIQLGTLLLIAMPVTRVLFVGICFAIERDWLYVTVAATVLVILLVSLIKH